MAKPFPWFPFNPDDYMRDTAHLTTVEHGAYLLLILAYWQHGFLPDDDRALARITRLPLKAWLTIRATLAALFKGNGPWRHKRIDWEISNAAERVMAARRNGSRGGTRAKINRDINRSRAANATANATAGATANATANAAAINKEVSKRADDEAEPATSSPPAVAAAGCPMAEPAEAPRKIASTELAATMHRKGWVR